MVVLAACTIDSDIDATQGMASKGSSFNQALHTEYVGLAKMENDEWDLSDSKYFNEKAKMAAQGKTVGPQMIEDRTLPFGKATTDLSAARKALVAALGASGTKKTPKDAARAQAMFDCWMQEQEENIQPEDIAACRSAFEAALKKVQAALAKGSPAKAAKPKRKRAKAPPVPGPYTVFFAFDSSALDAKAMAVIKEAADTASSAMITRMFLNGNADRSGSSAYNMALSKARVDAVHKALANLGLDPLNTVISPLGEEFPKVPTPDGKREGKNRRVDIKFVR
ncbi:MAG: OmpA family protein [Rhodospirillales bacterium]|nr:OmpA family protein [Alphaproteobacteria bacterium]MBL6948633.1 OmpA family protein [Rhodospirillales bacterium]